MSLLFSSVSNRKLGAAFISSATCILSHFAFPLFFVLRPQLVSGYYNQINAHPPQDRLLLPLGLQKCGNEILMSLERCMRQEKIVPILI
ncbi:hypothetical protein TNCT_726351 [Trichonephila clavata]|uniref:Uncharacterized protein n=1 Tax=Trichonephila clavata TaxID=2740835 RepID=A0A8X6HHE9_TRICU|nr:hypothetical protein TNCT_726351 [Trichonephila clavata]